MSKVILVVEDDQDMVSYLREFLTEQHYTVFTAMTGTKAVRIFEKTAVDLVLLDLHLPDISGEQLRDEFKKMRPEVPIVILTAESDTAKIASNLNNGADDYISKPFTTDELLARMRARMRINAKTQRKIKVKDLVMDLQKVEVTRADKTIDLTHTEFELLRCLLENKNRVLTREVLLSKVWSMEPDIQTRVVDVYIGYIRRKIDSGHKEKIIQSKRGYGYIIKED